VVSALGENLPASQGIVTISDMSKRSSQSGEVDLWLIMFIVVTILFLASVSFAVWAFAGRQDFKSHSDQKVSAAVTVAKQQEDSVKNLQFAQQEKQPYKTYVGPEAYGTLQITFPRTWSAYVDSSGQGSQPLDGYFNKDIVLSIVAQSSAFSLRVQVVPTSYTSYLNNITSLQQSGLVKVSAFSFPKLPAIVGVRVDGQVEDRKTGSMIIMPLRDKTLKLWTDAPSYIDDFNNIILPNFTFSP
jgi:hypothetical protein